MLFFFTENAWIKSASPVNAIVVEITTSLVALLVAIVHGVMAHKKAADTPATASFLFKMCVAMYASGKIASDPKSAEGNRTANTVLPKAMIDRIVAYRIAAGR